MPTSPKRIRASLISPLATLSLPALLSLFILLVDSFPAGGDASIRVAGTMLYIIVPIAYPILVVFSLAVGYILSKLRKLSLRNLISVNLLASIPAAVHLGWSSAYKPADKLIGLAIFLPFSALCLGLGAICWWFLAMRHRQPRVLNRLL